MPAHCLGVVTFNARASATVSTKLPALSRDESPSNTNPVTPCCTVSFKPPTACTTQGWPFLIASNWLSAVDIQCTGRFDLIVSNPPYIPTNDIAGLDPGVRDPDTALALDGGADGMAFIRALLHHVASHMTESAVLVLEIGHERPHFEAAFPTLQPLWLSTSAGDDQVLLLTRDQLT